MNEKEMLEEIKKCRNPPYYFATKYLKVKNTPYSEDMVDFYTPLNEEEFNKRFKYYDTRRNNRR